MTLGDNQTAAPKKPLQSFRSATIITPLPAAASKLWSPPPFSSRLSRNRLNTAYMLKESFGQLWSYEREGWARRFFENWRASLKWQRLKPYEMFAAMIDRHWDGIAAYCRPENKVSLGFVEGLNNKIRVIQRRAYGLRNEEYFRLKVLTCMLPEL